MASSIAGSLPRAILIGLLGLASIPALLLISACVGYLALVGKAIEWVNK